MSIRRSSNKTCGRGEQQRLLSAQQKLARDNESLVFALRETLAILADKTGVFTDPQKVACAKSHVILALGRYGTVPATQTTN